MKQDVFAWQDEAFERKKNKRANKVGLFPLYYFHDNKYIAFRIARDEKIKINCAGYNF